jgi:hypothetical protein
VKTLVACLVTAVAVAGSQALAGPLPFTGAQKAGPERGTYVCKWVPASPAYMISRRAK